MNPSRDFLALLCPSCKSSDLRPIGDAFASCKGCGAALRRLADGTLERMARLATGATLERPTGRGFQLER